MLRRGEKRLLSVLAFAATQAAIAAAQSRPVDERHAPRFEITFDAGVCGQPYAGRVFVLLSTGETAWPLAVSRWFQPEPFFAQEVQHWRPGESLVLDPRKCVGYPGGLDDLPAGQYGAQAVMVLNRWSHRVVNVPGNGYSGVVTFKHDPQKPPTVRLRITATLPRFDFKGTKILKYVKVKSDSLTRFYGHDVYLKAAVKLPATYQPDSDRQYPTLYIIPGFGGTVAEARFMFSMFPFDDAGLELVSVYLDSDCPAGHHVYADSANNGPWGRALVTELIPHLEKEFRLIQHVDARYLTGHSSGGWSSLWLQITYPDVFGGVWSTSPDPVDFHAFQWVDIYDAGANVFFDSDGKERMVGRHGPFAQLTVKQMSDIEAVFGRGGQLYSFQAVFSPRRSDGRPRLLYDPRTGRIDPKVAEAWRKYDICHILESNWATLGPKLEGKLHVLCGDVDTFFLERAVHRLRDTLKTLGSDAQVELIPGAGHMLPPSVYERIGRQIAKHYERRYVKSPSK